MNHSSIKRTTSFQDSQNSQEPESSRGIKRLKKATSFLRDDDQDDSDIPHLEKEVIPDFSVGELDKEDKASEDEASEDEASEDEASEDEDEQEQTRSIIQSRPRRILNFDKVDFNNMRINEAGTISRVEVVNFMCHKFLQIDLGPKINFIIGHNGSGKSAILTAITVALGANASATNRGKSLVSFIKEGTSAANVTIHLTNNGSNAYKPDIYPERIIVERRINKEGGTPYKLKSKSGRIISQKKEDLVDILDHFNLMVNNPLTMLTQDMARKFLSDSSPEDKYKLFMHGTQLTQLNNDFQVIRESFDSTQTILSRKKEGLSSLLSQATEARRTYEDLQAAKDAGLKIDELNNELVWCQIIRKEQEVAKNEKQIQELQKTLDEIRRDQDELKANIHATDRHILTVNEEWENFKNELNPGEEEKAKAKLLEGNAEMKLQLEFYKSDIKGIKDQIHSIEQARLRYEAELEDEINKLESSTILKRNQILQEIKDCELKITSKESQIIDLKANDVVSSTEIRQLEGQQESCQKEIKNHQDRISYAEKNIRKSESVRGDKMKAYGPRMPELIKAIRNETRWEHRRPVGPFGATLELLNPEYADVLEAVLSNSMNAFVVESDNDKKLLIKLMERCQMPYYTIYTSEYEVFDHSSGEPDPKYLTVLRALKFNDEWVKCQLITAHKIEKMLLMEDRAEADRLMYENRPHNIEHCFTIGGYKVGSNKGGMCTMALDQYRGPPRLLNDVDVPIAFERNIIDQEKTVMAELNNELKKINHNLRELTTQYDKSFDAQSDARREISRLEFSIEQKQDLIKDEIPVNLDIFNEDIKECNTKIERYKGQLSTIAEKAIKVKKSLEVSDASLEELKSKEAERLGKSDVFKKKIDSIEQKKLEYGLRLDELNVVAQTTKVRHERSRGLYAESLRLVESWIAQCAEDYPNRVETARKPNEIEVDISRYEGLAEISEETIGMSLDQAKQETYEALKSYEEAKKVIDGLEKIQRSISKMLTTRIAKWHAFRGYISLAAKNYFGYYLHLRGDEGSLRFNHTTKRLEIRVSTGDQYSKGSRQKDSRSLSGGEKSFSQISLLLSLWQSISSPLICLDEFDVFMDAVNRRQTMNMIMNAASENTSQYILITPQDASNMEPGPYISVHRMADPDRAN